MRLEHGDCLDVMRGMEAESIDAIVTDPPYGLSDGPTKYLGEGKGRGFMGRQWDHGVPGVPFWTEALRVAKPGAHLVAFGGTRTYHRLACAIEDAGWEIRDCLQWIYGSGFPKSLDVSKAIDRGAGASQPTKTRTVAADMWTVRGREAVARGESSYSIPVHTPATEAARQWSGWGTALKPAYEPIILARKPLRGTVAANVLEHGTGAINVDGCRVDGIKGRNWTECVGQGNTDGADGTRAFGRGLGGTITAPHPSGRWPANILLGCACEREHDPGCAVAMLDEQSGETRSTGGRLANISQGERVYGGGKGLGQSLTAEEVRGDPGVGDTGGASRFFYTAKASRSEREAGLEHRARRNVNDGRDTSIDNPYQRGDTQRVNTHPTVKPLSLMRWLCRLVSPPGGVVLDPFMGSGTTGCACVYEGFGFVGVDLEAEHVEIARGRIVAAKESAGTLTAEDIPPDAGPKQLGLL